MEPLQNAAMRCQGPSALAPPTPLPTSSSPSDCRPFPPKFSSAASLPILLLFLYIFVNFRAQECTSAVASPIAQKCVKKKAAIPPTHGPEESGRDGTCSRPASMRFCEPRKQVHWGLSSMSFFFRDQHTCYSAVCLIHFTVSHGLRFRPLHEALILK